MKIGMKVKDNHGEIGRVAEVFYTMVPAKKVNRYHNSKRFIDAVLIKVSAKHFIYRQIDKVQVAI